MMEQKTIYALASAQGVAGVAVIRISGAKAEQALEILTKGQSMPALRKTALRSLFDPLDASKKLDSAMVILL